MLRLLILVILQGMIMAMGEVDQSYSYTKVKTVLPLPDNLYTYTSAGKLAVNGDGSTFIVSFPNAPGPESQGLAGRALIYSKSGVGSEWRLRIDVRGGVSSQYLGEAIAISHDGNTAFIGSRLFGVQRYARDIFGNWTEQETFIAGPSMALGFELALSTDGNTVLVGNANGLENLDETKAYSRYNGTWLSTQLPVVPSNNPGSKNSVINYWTTPFALSLSGDGNTALVGRPFDSFRAGSAVVLVKNETGGWEQQGPKLTSSGSTCYSFGIAGTLSLDGNTVALACETGFEEILLYVFTRSNGQWISDDYVVPVTGRHPPALSGDGNVLIAAPSAYFRSTATTWKAKGFFTNSYATGISADASTAVVITNVGIVVSTAVVGTTVVDAAPPYLDLSPDINVIIAICTVFGIVIPFILLFVLPYACRRKPRCGWRTRIWYGTDVKSTQLLGEFLRDGGDPDFAPRFQRPWIWAKYPRHLLLTLLLVTYIYLMVLLQFIVRFTEDCVLNKQDERYHCPLMGDMGLQEGISSFIHKANDPQTKFRSVLYAIIGVLLFPLSVYTIAILAVGWGVKNTIGVKGGEQLSLLHFATFHQAEDSIRLLTEAGAYRQIQDAQGRTPLDIAKSMKCSPSIILLLTEDGALNEPTDVFCSHAWGLDGSNHALVISISDWLESRGIRSWIDKERLKGNIVQQMTRGIDLTKVVLVFITRAYLEKVSGPDETDNCKLEFLYAARVKSATNAILPVLLDKDLKDTRTWGGPVGFYLGKSLYVDCSSDDPDIKATQWAELERRIREMTAKSTTSIGTTSKKDARVKPEDALVVVSTIEDSDSQATQASRKPLRPTSPRPPVPNSEAEVRQWLESHGLSSIADRICQEGLANAEGLKQLARLSVVDLKSWFGLPPVDTFRFKNSLTAICADEFGDVV